MLAGINILLTIQELYLLGDLILICLSNGILTKSSTVCQYTGQVVVLKNLFIVKFKTLRYFSSYLDMRDVSCDHLISYCELLAESSG